VPAENLSRSRPRFSAFVYRVLNRKRGCPQGSGLAEVARMETCRPGPLLPASRPRICPAQRGPSARRWPCWAWSPLLNSCPLPALALDGLLGLSASAWRCSSCWSRWAWGLVPPLDFSGSSRTLLAGW